MNKIKLGVSGIAVLVVGILIGATIAYAAVTTFKIKENKIFFNLLEGQTQFALPSTIGRTGHVYIVQSGEGTFEVTLADSGDNISGSAQGNNSVTYVADEEHRTWWQTAGI